MRLDRNRRPHGRGGRKAWERCGWRLAWSDPAEYSDVRFRASEARDSRRLSVWHLHNAASEEVAEGNLAEFLLVGVTPRAIGRWRERNGAIFPLTSKEPSH